jgi:serine/threonine-protein kinase
LVLARHALRQPEQLDRLNAALADRYEVEAQIGRGGMATVFRARDLKLKRPVAIKVLHPELAATLGTERFLREVEIAAKLHHPHILVLHDSGEADGQLYYVMPLVEGESLRARLNREKQLPLDDALQIARELADALGYAHDHGVIHRDVKPENIMLQSGHAVVTDFGIAQAVSQAGGERLTETGLALGTPAYMSPEQAAGDRALDGRSDCYALACVLYEMLTGDPPFVASTAQAIIARHVTDVPPPITTVRPTVGVNAAAAIAKALSKAPADRFDSVTAFGAALTQPAKGASADRKSIAVLPFANMSADPENAFFSDGITEEIINALAQIPGLHVASRTSCFYFKGKTPEMAEVAAKLRVSTVLEGSVRRAGHQLRITVQLIDVAKDEHIWSERYDRTMDDVFAVQDEIAAAIADRMRTSLGPGAETRLVRHAPSDVRAYELYLKGRGYLYQRGMGIPNGLECMEQALEVDPDYPMALAGLADANTLMALYAGRPSAQCQQTALEAAHRAASLAPDLAEGHNALACAQLLFEWNWLAAEASFQRALELNPRYLQARGWYAGFYLGLVRSQFEEAIEQSGRCIESDPLSGYAHSMHACCLIFGGRPLDALPFAHQARALEPEAYLAHITTQMSHYWAQQWDESLAAGGTALAVSGRHPWSLALQCVCLADSGREAEARAAQAELTARAVGGYVQPFLLAQATAAIGDADGAIAYAEQAFDARDPALVLFGRNWRPAHHLQADRRFVEILRRMRLPDWEEGEIRAIR